MKNPLMSVIEKRKIGIYTGIPSFCCANKIVLEAILEQARRSDDTVLIEGTSNQVNQFGGYTGMTPMDFRDYTFGIARKIGFDRSRIILGGDHMGPLPWAELPAQEAMENAKVLVRLCVLAGYKKIHLDTSMRLGDDPADVPLSDEIIAERGVVLFQECEKAYQELLQQNPSETKPVFVIGSEVPIPGGAQEREDVLRVTDVFDFERTIYTYKRKLMEHGLSDSWKDIIAIVVQPGVEFGENEIHLYDRNAAARLCKALNKYPDIVFEGHSTDYQPAKKLKEMVEDGIAILKVGPALTFAVREALFALDAIEKQLIPDADRQAHFVEKLEQAMLRDPSKWEKYYRGSPQEAALSRKYSFSDRSRYYFILPEVEQAMETLLRNIDSVHVPMCMLHQYMPAQYARICSGKLELRARELVKDAVVTVVEEYYYAVKQNYTNNRSFS